MDFPGIALKGHSIVMSTHYETLAGQTCLSGSSVGGLVGWPAANRAIYIPFEIDVPLVAQKMVYGISTIAAGNFDMGIYSETGTRLVSTGSTALPGSGTFQSVTITSTTLVPGTYFMAMNVDTGTPTFNRVGGLPAGTLQMCGVQQQAVGAVTLPSTATFANPASAFLPVIGVAFVSTV